jgi:hypothetical protein
MGFDSDMRKVTERFKKWGDTAVITSDNFSNVDSLIQRHYDERGRLFDELQNALKRDTDVQSPWDNLCDKGLELNERLNSAIASKIPDGFRGIGMSDFYEGERAAWQNCKSGRIGLISEAIYDIGKNDVEIFKKLEEDLKKAREDAKIVDELARATFGDVRDSIRGVAGEIASILVAVPVIALGQIGKALAPQAKRAVRSFVSGSSAMREMAKKKRVAKDILVRNSDMVDKAKEQIGDGAIQNILKRAEEIANSWKSASRGDYSAADWDSFGRACCEILRSKAAPATEKAKILFDNMRPLYLEAIKTSFVTLLSDPSSLENFKGQLNDDTQKMFDDLAKENVAIALLRDSEPKRTADAEMKQILAEVTEALKELKNAIREVEEQMKA